ncbi:MAG: aminoglycoside 6-adenylyltransferase [Bifidobacteriaceae bacterium]|jgi:aminoglycoside 6-adenylyltransferase|nr:aminoglycoside 6-adenylyltransferase [Bifidobacteriaceae bacterium]
MSGRVLTVPNTYEDILTQLAPLVTDSEAIIGAAVVGSRAGAEPDESADLNLLLFTDSPDELLSSNAWLSSLGRPWVAAVDRSFPELPVVRIMLDNAVQLTLTVLAPGAVETLSAPAKRVLTDMVGGPLTVLKAGGPVPDQLASLGGESPAGRSGRPSQEEFAELVSRFWVDVPRAVRWLKRGEIWSARRLIDGPMKDAMVQVQAWITKSRRGGDVDTYWDGRHLEDWAGERFVAHLSAAMAPLDPAGAKRALVETMDQFRILGIQAAQCWALDYPEATDRRITVWVRTYL